MSELLQSVILVIGMMIMLKFAFAEFDGNAALKRQNLAYFLSFEDKFKYKKMSSTLMLFNITLFFFSGLDYTFIGGWIAHLEMVLLAMLCDFIANLSYHYYARWRYKKEINDAKIFLNQLSNQIQEDVHENDAYVYGQDYKFDEVVNDYVRPEDHFTCISADGGELMEGIRPYPQVSFLIDRKVDEAKMRLEGSDVRFTTLTKEKKYPFKDERMDVVVCYNENFDPNEGKRILKDDGLLLINQLGSENLIELYSFMGPRLISNLYNVENLKRGLGKLGYEVLHAHEEKAELRFRTIAAFYQYVKDIAFIKIDDLRQYVNQYYNIAQSIEQRGFYALRTHRFYVVAKKAQTQL